MAEAIKIKVGLPSYSGKVFPETDRTIRALSAYEDGVFFDVSIIPNGQTSISRSLAVTDGRYKTKQKFEWDYFLSMDADMSFPVQVPLMLIDRKKDIVSAAYRIRSPRSGALLDQYVAAPWGDFIGHADRKKFLSVNTTGLHKVDFVGMGCCIISKRVFETLDFPYFNQHVITWKDESYPVAEDVSFCIDAAAAGFEIWVDCDCIATHHPENDFR